MLGSSENLPSAVTLKWGPARGQARCKKGKCQQGARGLAASSGC